MISIDAFRQIELKVATVKSAEPHPNADKLMVLQVDLGAEQRQICAGIRDHYTPEDLVGRQIVVVANLADDPLVLRSRAALPPVRGRVRGTARAGDLRP